MLATPDPPLPVLTRDGALQTEPGYSEGSPIYYAPPQGFQLPEVPRSPAPKDLARAKALIFEDLLGDFPFADQASRAHALALVLLLPAGAIATPGLKAVSRTWQSWTRSAGPANRVRSNRFS